MARLLSLAGWLSLAGGFGFCLLGLSAFIAPGFWITDNMSFFVRQFLGFGICGFAGGLIGLAVRHRLPGLYRRLLLILLVLVVTLASLMVARVAAVTDTDATSASAGGKDLRLVSINLEHLFFGDESLFTYLSELDADIIVLQESGWEWQQYAWDRRVGPTQIAGSGPYHAHVGSGALKGIVIFSRYPIETLRYTPIKGPEQIEGYFDLDREFISLEIDVNGTPLSMIAVHPMTPRKGPLWGLRQDYFSKLREEADRLSKNASGNLVIIGDWNTSPWSGNFLTFLTDLDLTTSFPAGIPQTTRFFFDYRLHWLLGAVVDHVAVSPQVHIKAVALGPELPTDHLPLVVDLTIGQDKDASMD